MGLGQPRGPFQPDPRWNSVNFPMALRILGFHSFLFGPVLCLDLKYKQQVLWLLKKKKNLMLFFFFHFLCDKRVAHRKKSLFHTTTCVSCIFTKKQFEKYTAVLLLLEMERNITNSVFSLLLHFCRCVNTECLLCCWD